MKKLLLVPLLFAASCSHGPSTVEPVKDVVPYAKDDPAMTAAIAKAKKTLPMFIKRLPKLDPRTTMVKWAAFAQNHVEHIWVANVTYKDGWFEGYLANEPVWIEGKKLGDKVRFRESEVSDWGIYHGPNDIEGSYTEKVMEQGQ